jgi:acyl-[acyl-carrier-protein]-phospholipid O-acyltransferase/long-chain-fatty-acid--[acyl-carrier-protein] ligase
VWVALLAMVLISIQTTFYTPAKFGILPEIVEEPELSRANGTLNMFTYIAVILGSAVGGPIYDFYAPDLGLRPQSQPQLWLPGTIVLMVAALGLVATYGVPRLASQNPHVRIRPLFFRTYVETWREVSSSPVAAVIVAWSFFYLIVGGIAIPILPDYRLLLNISATKTALLMALLGISIGIGDFVAGRASGHRIRPELIPFGAIGTSVMFLLLAVIPLNFALVCGSLSIAGFLAGFVMVPLQTMTQQFSAVEARGRILGLWNCLSFVGIIVGNLIFLVIKSLGVPSNRLFAVCGLLGIVFLGLYYTTWRAAFLRGLRESVE